jgi:23S rRNA (uracil1939-C5)-methyltransferase
LKPLPIPSHDSFSEVTVSSLGGLGDGLASLNGKPLFIEKAAAGDRLKIRIIHESKEALRGEIVEVLEAGPDRIAPPCPYFSRCGGCGLQHITEISYQAGKRRVLAQALAHAGFPDTKAELTFLPAATRRRVEFKITPTSNGFSFAYYASRSRDVVAVENCLILEPALQMLMQPLSKALGAWAHSNLIKSVSLTATDSGLDMVINCTAPAPDTSGLEALAERFNIARISLGVPDRKIKPVAGGAAVTMRLGKYDVAIPAGAFLQASREGQRLLTEAVVAGVQGTRSIADLFCGIGTYSFALAKTATLHAVEGDMEMVKNLKLMVHFHGIQRFFTTEQRDLFKNPLTAAELARFDCVIVNPPRPGAKTQCEEIAKSKVSKVVMVSCNPASFARDAKALKAAGFALTHVQGIDQFVYSPHLEIVSVFER